MLIYVVAALLGGCWSSGEPARPYRTKAQRVKDAEIAVSRTPVPRTYRMPAGELQVFDVPTADSSGWLRMQQCVLWRDAEFRQASISCTPPDDFVGERAPEQPEPR